MVSPQRTYMSQGHRTNAATNLHSREIIQQSSLSNTELAKRFGINEKTVSNMKEIGAYYKLHYSRISRIIKIHSKTNQGTVLFFTIIF